MEEEITKKNAEKILKEARETLEKARQLNENTKKLINGILKAFDEEEEFNL